MTERIEAGAPVRLGSRRAGAPVRTGWDAPEASRGPVTRLDDLDDVDAPPARAGVLTRGPDGVIRPVEPWGDEVRVRPGPPTGTAPPGSVHVDITNGRTYRFRRSP